jgi:chorismate--pyruvate lyase
MPIAIVSDFLWLTADRLSTPLDPLQRDWLFEAGSLTRRLTELADGAFSVEPLLQGWQTLRDDECTALDLPSGSTGWVREVYLRGHGQPWVFARSVASRTALEHSDLDLEHQGSRSLGHLLFSDKAFARSPFEICHYPPAWLPPAVNEPQLWARRSCFQRGGLGVLVAEIFLPEHWRAAGQQADQAR